LSISCCVFDRYSDPLVHWDGQPIESLALTTEKRLFYDCLNEAQRAVNIRFEAATTENLRTIVTKGTRVLHYRFGSMIACCSRSRNVQGLRHADSWIFDDHVQTLTRTSGAVPAFTLNSFGFFESFFEVEKSWKVVQSTQNFTGNRLMQLLEPQLTTIKSYDQIVLRVVFSQSHFFKFQSNFQSINISFWHPRL
jgi:hypothetical protein